MESGCAETGRSMSGSAQRTFSLSAALGMFVARAVRAPLWLLVSAMLARVLAPEGLGTWAMVLAAAMLGNQVLLLWTQSITQRFGRAEWLSGGHLDNTWATRWPLLFLGLVVLFSLVFLAPFDWHARYYDLTDNHRWLVIPALVTLWLMGEAQGLQQVRERYVVLAWSPVAADFVLLLAIGALVVLQIQVSGPEATGIAIAVITTVGMITWGGVLIRELSTLRLAWHLPSQMGLRRATLFALPLVPGFLIGYFSEWCDYFLIGYFYDTHAVGLFHPAYQYMLILVGIPSVITSVLLPQVVTVMDNGGEEGLKGLVTRLAPQLTSLWAIISIAVVAILPGIFHLLAGAAYDESQQLLAVLLIAVPGAICSHVYGLAHFAQGRLITANLGLFGVKLVVNAVISFILLPIFGVVGAAIGSAVSYLILQWLFLADQHRHLNLRPGHASAALLIAHVAAISMAFIPTFVSRMSAAFVITLLILAWVRRSNLFTPAEVSAIMPPRSAHLLPLVTRALCRAA